MNAQTISMIIPSRPTSDGDGVKIRRVPMFDNRATDPFLMIDELLSDNPDDFIGGFPPHPHRGMETLTYLIHGSLEHRDHTGNQGMINSGGAQWMSAGRGIIHSEMPAREMQKLHGFQLWINLPASEKMQPPKYRDVPAEEIPQANGNGWQASIIAGDWQLDEQHVSGPLNDLAADAAYADLSLAAGASVKLTVSPQQTLLAFVFEGQLDSTPEAPEKSMLVFPQGESVRLSSTHGARMILLRGTPIREKVVHYGPFVMNSIEEINQAIADYKSGNY